MKKMTRNDILKIAAGVTAAVVACLGTVAALMVPVISALH